MLLDESAKIYVRDSQIIKPNHRGLKRPVRCLGFDIETYYGKPYILSLYCPEAGIQKVLGIEPGSGQGFLRLLDAVSLIDASCEAGTIAGAHFMRFDLGVLVYDYLLSKGKSWGSLENPEQIELSLPQGTFSLRLGNVVFATLKTRHRTITFIDTSSYFKTGLNSAAESIGVKERKLAKPKGLGFRRYSLSFISAYALQDSRLCYFLLRQIVAWWKDYEILPSISAPQMAGRVFLHKFVKTPWVRIPQSVMGVSLLAYHGGKNGCYVKPGWYHARSYDIRSAYPWAMTQIPQMSLGQWIWQETPPKPAEEFSFVVVKGEIPKEQRFPVLFDHDFKAFKAGVTFDETAISGMEYLLMVRLFPKWNHHVLGTVVWRYDRNFTGRDLADYAREMFARRERAANEVESTLYKLLNNSLYGKFIARTPQVDGTYLGGQLFYPPVASWITALVRCRITELEYQSDALHTSTDGFIVASRPIATWRDVERENLGDTLGDLKFVNEGPLLLLRNKLYLHFGMDGRLKSYALHGFQGTVRELWEMVRRGKTDYTVDRLQGWREARRVDGLPFANITRDMSLHIPEIRRGLKCPKHPLFPRRLKLS